MTISLILFLIALLAGDFIFFLGVTLAGGAGLFRTRPQRALRAASWMRWECGQSTVFFASFVMILVVPLAGGGVVTLTGYALTPGAPGHENESIIRPLRARMYRPGALFTTTTTTLPPLA